MRMEGQEESQNVEDVRDSSGSGGFRPIHGVGIGGVVVALVGGWLFGVSPMQILGLLSGGSTQGRNVAQTAAGPAPPATDAEAHFVSQVLRSTEVVWTDYFHQMGKHYEAPKLRLFRDSYPTACGQGLTASGPFYCSRDRYVYLDMSFFDVMSNQLGAPGQFAQAYVIGHEVGHHVQNLLGTLAKVDRARSQSSEAESNALSVRLELQADCYAGVWANRSQQEQGWRLDPGDIETALNAASQIGDDTLQRRSQGTVVPESFQHGTSAQRVGWFNRGFSSGNINQCDTFGATSL
jgi:predicted metalloprotease